jgi:hypothetical protein
MGRALYEVRVSLKLVRTSCVRDEYGSDTAIRRPHASHDLILTSTTGPTSTTSSTGTSSAILLVLVLPVLLVLRCRRRRRRDVLVMH